MKILFTMSLFEEGKRYSFVWDDKEKTTTKFEENKEGCFIFLDDKMCCYEERVNPLIRIGENLVGYAWFLSLIIKKKIPSIGIITKNLRRLFISG